ncbi:MAG TPA: Hsp20/alpha crystallin family protein [Candidatus Binatia bacterium]|nr:Hsp20/alpha crystallin family protein [Candidatus Binatia bacterium]
MAAQEVSVRKKQEVKREEPTRPGRAYLPDVDIYETNDSIWLWADMPGVDETQVQMNLAEGVLTIEGQVSVQEYEKLAPIYSEYNVGNYLRRFTISSDIDSSRISGKMTNGVLEIELPKAESAKAKRIKIST